METVSKPLGVLTPFLKSLLTNGQSRQIKASFIRHPVMTDKDNFCLSYIKPALTTRLKNSASCRTCYVLLQAAII